MRPFLPGPWLSSRVVSIATAAIVLAAGSSSRLGRPKQLLEWGGRTLLGHVVESVWAWPVESVVVVLGHGAEDILDAVDLGGSTVAINESWDAGMATSLRVGFDVLTRDPRLEAAFVALGDQPKIPDEVPGALLEAAEQATRPAIVPVYRYERGNPVLFLRPMWPRLMTLDGDAGASDLLRAHDEWVEEVRIDHLPPKDIDTEADLADMRRGTRPREA